MRKDRQGLNRALLPSGILLAIAAAAGWFWTEHWPGGGGERPAVDRVEVVDAPNVPTNRPASLRAATPARATERETSSALMVTQIRQAYPMLSDVVLDCEVDRCALRGTIRPPMGQADLDKRQEMLLGGLGTVVAANGYRLVVPFQMDEIDDNTFLINASMTRAPRAVALNQ